MIDRSTGDIVSWQWDFGDNTTYDYTQNPYHTYEDSVGIYQTTLIVTDDMGCTDTSSKLLWITDEYWLYIPNSFTPDNNKLNDKFCISYHGIRATTFTFNIYNQFSDLVYGTNNIEELNCSNGWDGKHQTTGLNLPLGVYIYEIYYQDFDGWKHQKNGTIIIVR